MMTNPNKKYQCPCCGYYTFDEPNSFEICDVCFWQDDGVQADNPDYLGGPNHISLNQARQNYKSFGAKDKSSLKYVRQPLPEEMVALDTEKNDSKS